MPRKAAKRARTSKPVERDWRATLFVWRGELEIGGSPDTGPQISWRGAWLGTDDDTMPSDADLKASANTFELKTEPFDHEQIQEKANATLVGTEFEGEECGGTEIVFEAIDMILGGMDEEDPEGRKAFFQLDGLFEMKFGGSYKLDNGDGLEDTSDDTHRWEVRSWPKAAPERSSARLMPPSQPSARRPSALSSASAPSMAAPWLARRYIADDDPRAAWASPAAIDGLDDAQLEEEEDALARRYIADVLSRIIHILTRGRGLGVARCEPTLSSKNTILSESLSIKQIEPIREAGLPSRADAADGGDAAGDGRRRLRGVLRGWVRGRVLSVGEPTASAAVGQSGRRAHRRRRPRLG